MKKGRKMIKLAGAIVLVGLLAINWNLNFNTSTVSAAGEYLVNGEMWNYGLGDAIGFNENTYTTITTTSKNNNWRHGSVSGNGELGFIESCDPNEDVMIINNTKIVSDTTSIYHTPEIAGSLDRIRTGAIKKTEYPWLDIINAYAVSKFGASSWGTTWPRPYQPAAQYRMKNNDYTSAGAYNRYTNYETGEVGLQWKNADKSCEWDKRSFASRSDNVIVTSVKAGANFNITLSIDAINQMQGTPDSTITASYFVESDSNGYALGMVGKYGIRNRVGTLNPEETLLAHGGWGTATRIIAPGATITQGEISGRPTLTFTGTNSIMLITKADLQVNGCNTLDDVRTKCYNRLRDDIDGVVAKYKAAGQFTYEDILAPHAAIHGKMFNTVRLNLCNTDEEKADRLLSNSQLIAKQNSQTTFNKAYMERAYYNGRFALICASGYQSTRLGGIWTGMWNPDWSGDFTLDANLNLQVSGMNTGNMKDANRGYINLMLRQLPGWVNHATNVYGMTDAILAPPRTDGVGGGDAYHFLSGYPHLYVNGITDWLLIPIFEYWQCYGNSQVPIGQDVNINDVKTVLGLTDADVARINSDGYFDLEKDLLFPLLDKNMNFWLQFASERYYKDGNGVNHVNDGTTLSAAIAAGDTKAKYIFAPGYSPENAPSGGNVMAFNSTMDISAAKNSVYMAETVLKAVYPGDAEKATKLAQWEAFASKVPVYLYNSDGALQEWCDPSLKDNYSHRHTSHAYSAWPAHEAMGDPALAVGVQRALDMRYSYNASAAESHAHDHRALVEARLGNASGLATPLMWLTKNNYRFNSFMTSHNNSLGSAYCTDLNDSYPGIINESLVYSYDNRIKILPALLSDLNKGSITGLRARCNTLVNALVWDINAKTASITLTTDRDINPIMLGCGVPWKKASINGAEQEIKTDTLGAPYIDLTLSKGNTVTIDFELADTTLSSLKVNGKPLSNFSPVVYNYSMLIPSGMPSTPQVTATANSPSATVAITQASAMSGQATVTVTDGNGKSVYTVNFGYAGSSDEFSGSTLGSQWSWVREDPTKWSLTNNPGFMTITPQTGDLNTTTNTAKNILLQNAFGDWTMESKLVFSIMPHAQYQQGGIIAYQDDNNYLKVDWEYYSANTLRFNVISESGGTVTTPFYVTNPAVNSPYNVWFRMVKSANNYSIYYSLDGNTFALIGSTSVTLSNIRAGLIAYNRTGTSTDLNVMFDYFHLTNTSEQVNSSPTLAALPNYTVDEGKLFALSLSGSDSDTNDALTYSATNLPAGASLNPVTGKFSWTPEFTQAGVYTVQFAVTDGYLTTQKTTIIVVNNADQAPVITAISNYNVNAGQTISFNISASDPDPGDTLIYSAGTLPTGATFDPGTKIFSWTPPVAGTFTVQFTVSDGQKNASTTATIVVNAITGDKAPVMSAIPSYIVKSGKLVSFTVKATDPDNDPLTYSVVNLPTDASFNPVTKKFSWTPTAAGTYSVQFTVNDGQLTDSKIATIIVQ